MLLKQPEAWKREHRATELMQYKHWHMQSAKLTIQQQTANFYILA